MKNKSFVFLLLLSLAGFFDSAYLTILHYKNVIPPCAIAKGCETVLTSRFSVFFGIPIALIGSLFFLALIFLLLLGFSKYFKLLISFIFLHETSKTGGAPFNTEDFLSYGGLTKTAFLMLSKSRFRGASNIFSISVGI